MVVTEASSNCHPSTTHSHRFIEAGTRGKVPTHLSNAGDRNIELDVVTLHNVLPQNHSIERDFTSVCALEIGLLFVTK